MTFGMRLLLLAVGTDGMVPALVPILDLAGRSLSEGFVNLDAALLSVGNVAHSLETNSNGY
jgi:hypothetical protein